METLLPPLFDESFEIFSKKEQARREVDYLLDMCGAPHHRKKIKESSVDGGTFSLGGRPYDHPRQIRITPIIDIIDIDEETDVAECDEYEDSPKMDSFEGAELEDGEKEEPAQDSAQKLTNKINNVPNQNAPALLKAVKGELLEASAAYQKFFKSMLAKYGVSSPAELSGDKKKAFFNAVDKGWKAKNESADLSEVNPLGRAAGAAIKKVASPLVRRMNAIQASRRAKGLPAITRKQAARMAIASMA